MSYTVARKGEMANPIWINELVFTPLTTTRQTVHLLDPTGRQFFRIRQEP